ncbi:MAG TPA: methionine ABC transporter permease [Syntrophomonadaceae bacterium]|nr:methionine ABC transporter permease [Syntrophomonadaceae bacterium]
MNEDLLPLILAGLQDTVYMVALSALIAAFLGFPIAVLLIVSEKGGIMERPNLNRVLGAFVNLFRSFPTIILIVVLLPLSRWIVGTTLGATAAVVPLSIGSAPFLARIIENSLKEVERGKIEAARAMGASPQTIVFKVMFPEALPALVRGITLAIITITGFTAVAGAVGAGGLGSLAIRFGYMRYRNDVMFATVALLVVLVQLVQWCGDRAARKINSKRYRFD